MSTFVVIENRKRWPLELQGVEVVSARDYLADPRFASGRRHTVFNLCRSYGYQSLGYYVSLLAAARGHRPVPSVSTIQDLKLAALVRIVSEDLNESIQRALKSVEADRFELSIYFGHDPAARHDRLALALFGQYPAPFLRASFECVWGPASTRQWHLAQIKALATSDVPDHHHDFVVNRAQEFFRRPPRPRSAPEVPRYHIAILTRADEAEPPSDEKALRRFQKAARALGMEPTIISRQDYGRVPEFDALFIREMTQVDHYTYRFARRATAEGLVVIDDPESIVRCTNKVFQAEAFERAGVATPRTLVVHSGNTAEVEARVGLPCVLKSPDSAFSQGVHKVKSREELASRLSELLADSDLVVAQEFTPSDYDWRIGVLGGVPLFACKYFMAPGHWQIIKTQDSGRRQGGAVDTLPLDQVPTQVLDTAVRACRLMGDGLYGVDLKEFEGVARVIEVNDNPSLEAGYEDRVLGEELYLAIMRHFRDRLDARSRGAAAS